MKLEIDLEGMDDDALDQVVKTLNRVAESKKKETEARAELGRAMRKLASMADGWREQVEKAREVGKDEKVEKKRSPAAVAAARRAVRRIEKAVRTATPFEDMGTEEVARRAGLAWNLKGVRKVLLRMVKDGRCGGLHKTVGGKGRYVWWNNRVDKAAGPCVDKVMWDWRNVMLDLIKVIEDSPSGKAGYVKLANRTGYEKEFVAKFLHSTANAGYIYKCQDGYDMRAEGGLAAPSMFALTAKGKSREGLDDEEVVQKVKVLPPPPPAEKKRPKPPEKTEKPPGQKVKDPVPSTEEIRDEVKAALARVPGPVKALPSAAIFAGLSARTRKHVSTQWLNHWLPMPEWNRGDFYVHAEAEDRGPGRGRRPRIWALSPRAALPAAADATEPANEPPRFAKDAP